MTKETATTNVTSTLLVPAEVALFRQPIDQLKERLFYDQRLARLWCAFEEHFADSTMNLDRSCRAAGMSKNNLNSLLRNLTNHTCCSLLNAYRLYRSVLMALETNNSFTEIALSCGFDSLSSYSRAFSKVMGNPPTVVLRRGTNYRRHIWNVNIGHHSVVRAKPLSTEPLNNDD
jgi:AraC-like DNA-binding protein